MPRVPADQLHLPRHERQHPYRAAGPHEAADALRDIDQFIRLNDDLWLSIADQFMPTFADRVDVEHAASLVRELLWRKMPLYDAWRTPFVKATTFAFVIGRNRVKNYSERFTRAWSRRPRSLSDMNCQFLIAKDERADGEVWRLAADIAREPEKYMPKRQAEVLRALLAKPVDMELQELARDLGFAQPSSLSMIMQRIKKSISRAAEDLVLTAA